MIPGLAALTPDLIGTAIAALFTLFVFSYLLGDVPGLGVLCKAVYRLALHVLIGASVAYALLVAAWTIFYPYVYSQIRVASIEKNWPALATALAGVFLSVLLLTKGLPSLAWLGNIATGYLIGVGLGVAAGGAILGTLILQSQATAMLLGVSTNRPLLFLINYLILVPGTLAVLISFTFNARWRTGPLRVASQAVQGISAIGRLFLYVALGAAFAGVYTASVSVFIGRVQWFQQALTQLGTLLR